MTTILTKSSDIIVHLPICGPFPANTVLTIGSEKYVAMPVEDDKTGMIKWEKLSGTPDPCVSVVIPNPSPSVAKGEVRDNILWTSVLVRRPTTKGDVLAWGIRYAMDKDTLRSIRSKFLGVTEFDPSLDKNRFEIERHLPSIYCIVTHWAEITGPGQA